MCEKEFITYGAIHIYTLEFTPEIAQEWLKANTNNRRLSDPDVARYTRDMENGDWIFIGDPVRRGIDGEVYDAQHRLEAIVRSGRSQVLLVVDGLPAAAKPVIDTGRKRQFRQNLSMRGEQNASLLASTLQQLSQWINGTAVSSNYYPTNSELNELLEQTPELRVSVELASKVGSILKCNPTSVALSHFLCAMAERSQANEFFSSLASGAGLSLGHPALTLRERLIRAKANEERLTGPEQSALMIIAWNAYRQSRTLSKLYFPKIGLSNETFPKAK